MSTSTATSDGWADQYENSHYAAQRLEETKTTEAQREQQAREAWGMKQQLQQARSNHTFTVEMYDVELPFNPLSDEAKAAISGKRERMAHCIQNEQIEEFIEQTEELAGEAPTWLAEAWDGDSSMSRPEDWTDTYDETELMKLLSKVDQQGEGGEMEVVQQFLG